MSPPLYIHPGDQILVRPWNENPICYISYLLFLCLYAKTSVINIDNWLSYYKSKYMTFDPTFKGSGGCGRFFDTVVLVYRHLAIMVHSEKLSGEILSSFHKKIDYSFCFIIAYYKSRAITLLLMTWFYILIGYWLSLVLIICTCTKNASNLTNYRYWDMVPDGLRMDGQRQNYIPQTSSGDKRHYFAV